MKHADALLVFKRILGHGHEDEIARNVRYARSGSGQFDEVLRRKQVRALLEPERGLGAMSNHDVVLGDLKRHLVAGERVDEAGKRKQEGPKYDRHDATRKT